MNIQVYDFEVTAFDWIVVFQDYQTGEFTVFHNDPEGVVSFVNDDTIYIGFNTKDYDQFIMKAVCGGCEPEEIKEINDYLIAGGRGCTSLPCSRRWRWTQTTPPSRTPPSPSARS